MASFVSKKYITLNLLRRASKFFLWVDSEGNLTKVKGDFFKNKIYKLLLCTPTRTPLHIHFYSGLGDVINRPYFLINPKIFFVQGHLSCNVIANKVAQHKPSLVYSTSLISIVKCPLLYWTSEAFFDNDNSVVLIERRMRVDTHSYYTVCCCVHIRRRWFSRKSHFSKCSQSFQLPTLHLWFTLLSDQRNNFLF